MNNCSKLSQAIQQGLSGISKVTTNLQARPDYKDDLVIAVQKLDEFKLTLLNCQATGRNSSDEMAVRDCAHNVILPMLDKLIDANIKMIKMGPLNINKTIGDGSAKCCNGELSALRDCLLNLIAIANADLSPSGGAASRVEAEALRVESNALAEEIEMIKS